MTIAPFEPVLNDRRLSGRGSCDIKGGMTSMLGALVRVLEEQPRPRPTIVMACTVNEEHGFTGATALCSIWSDATNERTGLRNSEQKEYRAMIPRRPNAAIVAEPTNLQVVVAHKGMVRWRCHTLGRAAHSSTPERGANAIFRMAQVLAALERYQQEKVGLLSQHALCGRPTLSVGTITGGLSVNTVPDRCTIEIDRRLVPGENPRSAQQQVIDYVAAETGLADQILHDAPCMLSPGLNNERNQLLAARMRAAAFAITGEDTPPCGVAFGTDAALIGAAGVPCVVFGPGSIAQAHTADEWVPMAEVELASEALYRLIIDWTAR
jgi:acetylornithine deacetylase